LLSYPTIKTNQLKKFYGLIGYPLSHSFSKKYFGDKFQKENIDNCQYDLFEINNIALIEDVFQLKNLKGFNVTIPYKHDIMKYMDDFDHSAKKVGAVNVVKIDPEGKKTGYNSDYYGFRTSLENWLPDSRNIKALILGIGGAAKAVIAVLNDLSIPFLKVSRDPAKGDLSYEDLKIQNEVLIAHQLIINTTPLGMSPNIDSMPDINYEILDENFYLFDLIYNPSETKFLAEGKKRNAYIKNGLEMLELQAEKSWEIWNR
jgi:shikimate dehydrogenase